MKAFYSVLLFAIISVSSFPQTPKLSSFPAAEATIFLDFDGQLVTGTSWNWSGPINAQHSGLSQTAISEIFNRVAEDYRIFDLNITTDSSVFYAAPPSRRTRIIITPTYQWYGRAGGVAYIGSFLWRDDTPAWVFSGLLSYNVKYIAEAVSHEAGHTLGLYHQSAYNASCAKTAEYYSGQGSGEIGWAPIMGVGYYKNITTWHNGTTSIGCNSFQDDISVITRPANGFGLRLDDHGNTHTTATSITQPGTNFTASGMINAENDKDAFKFDVTLTTHFRLNAIPQNVGSGNSGANVDIKISLLDLAGDTIGSYNPTDLLNAGVDTNLITGSYYLVVEGVANSNLADYSSVGFYFLTGSLDVLLRVPLPKLTGEINGDVHSLTWRYETDERILRTEIEMSRDASFFVGLATLTGHHKTYTVSPPDKSASVYHYRVKVITVAGERTYYSNVIALRNPRGRDIDLMSNVVTTNIQVYAYKPYAYHVLDETGKLLQQGALTTGNNRIDVSGAKKGLLLLRVSGRDEAYTYKIIKQ